LHRRSFLAAVAVQLAMPAIGEAAESRTLKFIPQADVAVVDPIWPSAYVTRNHAVERSFAWLSRYRRLNTTFGRSKEHLIAFIAIAFISILSRRLKRLVVEELSA
jgi:hypothetical protein